MSAFMSRFRGAERRVRKCMLVRESLLAPSQTRATCGALCLLLALVPTGQARAEEPKPAEAKADGAKSAADSKNDDKEKDKKPEDKPDRWFAVTNANIHTITSGDVHDATLLAKNGRIYRIGRDIDLPKDTEVLDARGLHVYPGFVAAGTGNVLGSKPADNTDVYGLSMTMALAGGITTMIADNHAAKHTYGTVEDMIVKRDLFKPIRYSTSDPDARRRLRDGLIKVRQYLRDLQEFEEKKKLDPKAKEPEKEWLKGEYETYLKLLRHETVGEATANTAQELLDLCELARQFDLRIVVRGATEGWTVAPQMARAGLLAIITPRDQRDADDRLNRENGSSIENAAILHRHGVPLAVVPSMTSITTWGVAGRDLLQLNMEAAFAVRGGLPNDAALRAITIDAARVLGVDHRVGSLEPGKDADLIVVDGDPLHYMTMVRYTVVNGRVVYDKDKEPLYSHIRPEGKLEAPPPDDHWPRRLGVN